MLVNDCLYTLFFFNNIEEREERFYKCLNQYLSLGYNVVVYWMNFEEIKVSNKNLTVIKNKQRNASYARNKLLSVFYNSNEQYCILSDDDTFLNNKIIPKVDCESYVNDYNKGKTFTEKISSSFLVLRNIRPMIFFDENLEANQDLDFGTTLNKLRFKTIRNSTEQVEIFRGQSSMFENGADKIYKKQKSLTQIKNKYENI